MKKFFKTYLPFTGNEIKRNLAYKGAFYLFVFCSLFGSFISYYLWKAIYGSADGGAIGGLTQNQMVIYVFMTYVTSSIVKVSISEEVSDDVVKGTVAMNLIKPIDYRFSLIFKGIGSSVYRFLVPGIFVWIGVELYSCLVLHEPFTGIVNLVLYLCSAIFSFFIYVLFDFCFGMIAFYTTYMFGMNTIKNVMISFFSGQLIPLNFFPSCIKKIIEFLPFSSMNYTPVMIFLGKYDINVVVLVLLKQFFWIIVFYILGSKIWKCMINRLTVLGG